MTSFSAIVLIPNTATTLDSVFVKDDNSLYVEASEMLYNTIVNECPIRLLW